MIYFLSFVLIIAFFVFRAGTFTGDMLRYYSGYLGVLAISICMYLNSLPSDVRNASSTFLLLLGALFFIPFSFQVMFRLGLPLLETAIGVGLSFIAYSLTSNISICVVVGVFAMWLLSLKTLKLIPIKLSLNNYTKFFKANN